MPKSDRVDCFVRKALYYSVLFLDSENATGAAGFVRPVCCLGVSRLWTTTSPAQGWRLWLKALLINLLCRMVGSDRDEEGDHGVVWLRPSVRNHGMRDTTTCPGCV